MQRKTFINMKGKKHIALVAHDNMKKSLLEWAEYNKDQQLI